MADEQQQVMVIERPRVDVVQTGSQTVVVERTDTQTVVIGISGPQGTPGPQGEQGPQGPQGIAGAASGSYRHVQTVPSDTWTVAHNLGGYLNVTTVDSTKREIIGGITYIDLNTIEVKFSGAVAGEAYVS